MRAFEICLPGFDDMRAAYEGCVDVFRGVSDIERKVRCRSGFL